MAVEKIKTNSNKPSPSDLRTAQGQDGANVVGQRKRVFVAMSGGVDSSVAALCLREKGFLVTGIFMRNWHANIHDGFLGDCPWQEDWSDVQAVCNHLGINCQIWDFSQEYYEKVVNYFFREYEAGRTPNPDVMCNKTIKFGIFLEKASAQGADFVATGHYARKVKSQQFKEEYELLAGVDKNKDQSYFLWTLRQDQLRRILFPLGEYTKQQVREIAKAKGLPNWNKKDSQGICFIGKIDVQEFLKTRLPERKGLVITSKGKLVGQHTGAYFFTEGQRHGLGIGGGEPYYVVKKDIKQNIVVVAPASEYSQWYRKVLIAVDINWISGRSPSLPSAIQARVRYRQPLQSCVIQSFKPSTPSTYIVFDKPQRAISPGQSVVFYQGEKVLGGGIIDRLEEQV